MVLRLTPVRDFDSTEVQTVFYFFQCLFCNMQLSSVICSAVEVFFNACATKNTLQKRFEVKYHEAKQETFCATSSQLHNLHYLPAFSFHFCTVRCVFVYCTFYLRLRSVYFWLLFDRILLSYFFYSSRAMFLT